MPCHHNQVRGRRYEVLSVRDIFHPCPIFEEVVVCDIREAEIDVAIDLSRAFDGASFAYAPPSCNEKLCENSVYCMAEGLKKGDRCTIESVRNEISCQKKGNLAVVRIKRSRD
jgi:uncharacterized protein (UPF0179 family)